MPKTKDPNEFCVVFTLWDTRIELKWILKSTTTIFSYFFNDFLDHLALANFVLKCTYCIWWISQIIIKLALEPSINFKKKNQLILNTDKILKAKIEASNSCLNRPYFDINFRIFSKILFMGPINLAIIVLKWTYCNWNSCALSFGVTPKMN